MTTETRDYYKTHLAKLETPAFVAWFEGWYGTEDAYVEDGGRLLDEYWNERRFALLGWHASQLPAAVSGNAAAFVGTLYIQTGV